MNKKGFTLIELLAVILILGIIALIAIPQVTKIIEESRRGAFNTTVQNLVSAVEKQCTLDMLKKEDGKENTYTISNGVISPNVDIKGTLPSSGTIVVSNECLVTEVNVTDGEFAAILKYQDEIIVKNKGELPGFAIYYNPNDNKVCTKEEAATNSETYISANGHLTGLQTGCMKWYVVEAKDNNDDAIDVILDHNVKGEDGTYTYNDAAAKVENLGWDINLKPRLLKPSEVAAITGADREDTLKWADVKQWKSASDNDISLDNNISTYFLDGMKCDGKDSYDIWGKRCVGTIKEEKDGKEVSVYKGMSGYHWLFDYTNGCIQYGCKIEDAKGQNGYWLEKISYDSKNKTLVITNRGKFNDDSSTKSFALRPVISIPKSKLQ